MKQDLISLDTETTGIDFNHGARPFLVTSFDETGCKFWEWDVNPLDRSVIVPKRDKQAIRKLVSRNQLVFHNPKFDISALQFGGIVRNWRYWSATFDTLHASHILRNDRPHNLTYLALKYLGLNLSKYEQSMKNHVMEARKIVKRDYPNWQIAIPGLACMPSAGPNPWKYDTWLPRALAKHRNLPKGHPWYTVTAEYANSDSEATYWLAQVLFKKIKELGLWGIYLESLKLLPVIQRMERRGITLSSERMQKLQTAYETSYSEASDKCVSMASERNFELELPKASLNNSLREFCFGSKYLNLPVVKTTSKGQPSLDKFAKMDYLNRFEHDSFERKFIDSLNQRSRIATSLGYMESYRKFWRRNGSNSTCKLFSSVNMTGTQTLRPSSSNPNQQQISKLKDADGRNVRYVFGPAPGREWWALDFDNLELRIPAFESGEPEMVDLFERPNEPPYYGSYHLLIFDTLHPREFREHGVKVKEVYKDTLYQWTKNGNFADQYGAIDTGNGRGTADRAYHMAGAQAKVSKRLQKKRKLNKYWIDFANRNGFVETLPDQTVLGNGCKSYRLYCPTNERGYISPTIPLNYHVQGTACWIARTAMVKVHDYLVRLTQTNGKEYYLIMYIHDEFVFDFPYAPNRGNLPKINRIRKLMESSGDDVGIPLTVGVDYHPNNWAESE